MRDVLDCLTGGVVRALTGKAYNLNVAGSNPAAPTSWVHSSVVERQIIIASQTCADDSSQSVSFVEMINRGMPRILTTVAYKLGLKPQTGY